MKLIKSILLGSAAGICAIATASAADLPVTKSAPVEYVRVCSQRGEGFFYVPGSDTCIRIGGRVRADTLYVETNNRNRDSINFAAQARINVDVRTNTPYGMVRAYLRYSLSRVDRNYGDGFDNGTTGVASTGGLDQAYIQFAGLTAGRLQSFFDFYADNYNMAAIRSPDSYTQVLAYTASFGNGWSLTASLEDGNERRVYNNTNYGFSYGTTSAGQSMPDVVAALMVDQNWGAAQLSAALHQVRPAFIPGANGLQHDTEYGFAVHGGVKLNLPMIAPGDELWFEAAYADGALGYIGAANYSLAQGSIALPMTDAFVDVNGRLKKTKGWSAAIDLLHYWTPSIRQNVFASYMKLNYGNGGYSSVTDLQLGTYNVGFIDASEWRVGTNVIWSPIKNFDIGVEVLYTRVDPKGRVLSNNNGVAKTVSSDDAWQGRLRIQRDF